MKKYDVTVAGYLCIDLIPGFKRNEVHTDICEVLKPGKLIEIEGLDASLGGIVANTGVTMKRFGRTVFLNGIIGDDFIGRIARELLDNENLSDGIQTIRDQETAFGLVISPPGVDRIFLESPGCSRAFDITHINFDAIATSKLFHFGYPPLLKQFYNNEGEQLYNLFRKVEDLHVATSLDFSLPDPESESGKVDWPGVLRKVLPYTDIFVPSLEEALLITMPEEYNRIQVLSERSDLIDRIPLQLIQKVGKHIIDWGCKIVLIKAGHRGAYLFTGDVASLNKKSGFNLSEEIWNYESLWCRAYRIDEALIKNASGAGDTSAAAFLTALLNGEDPEVSLKYAAIAGRNNLYCLDLSGKISTWEEMTGQITSEVNEIINLKSLKTI